MIDKAVVEAYLARELDDWSWVKKLSRGQLLAELDRLKHPFAFKTKPWTHQLAVALIGAHLRRFAILLDMGLGKSKIMLDLMSYRRNEGTMTRALVLVPRLVNIGSWMDDIRVHSDLRVQPIVGTTAQKWELLTEGEYDIALADYRNFGLLLHDRVEVVRKGKKVKEQVLNKKRVSEVAARHNFLVLDEIQKCRNHDALQWKALYALSKLVEFSYGMTGTPFGRSPITAWAQFKLVDLGDTFGTTISLFREAFFTESFTPFGPEWKFNKRRTAKFREFLRHGSLRYTEAEGPDLPPKIVQQITVPMAPDQREHYRQVLKGRIEAGEQSQEVEAIYVRLRQIASGYLEWDDPDSGQRVVMRFAQNPKLEALEELVEAAGDEKLVVFYSYTTTGRIICEMLDRLKVKHRWLYGGQRDPLEAQTAFKTDPSVRVLVANTQSGGSGLNLQVARYVVFFECPAAPDDRWQAEKRCARPGQQKTVYVYDLVAEKSIDLRVLDFIREGKDLHESLVNGRSRKALFQELLTDA